ncbi:polyketide cyclase, partial [Streptomyces sp. NPDC058247]
MSGQFEATFVVARPVDEVFEYLADGRNDPQFSPRVLKIERVPDTPTNVGTVFR